MPYNAHEERLGAGSSPPQLGLACRQASVAAADGKSSDPTATNVRMATSNATREDDMTTLFVRHTVSDYKTWRKVYDTFSAIQKANGVTAQAVYQAIDNPKDVTVTHEFATPEAAQAFTRLEELGKAMQSGGVVGTPTVWFTQKV
jgi:hypothetical protein